jgi:hypothetical protein
MEEECILVGTACWPMGRYDHIVGEDLEEERISSVTSIQPSLMLGAPALEESILDFWLLAIIRFGGILFACKRTMWLSFDIILRYVCGR